MVFQPSSRMDRAFSDPTSIQLPAGQASSSKRAVRGTNWPTGSSRRNFVSGDPLLPPGETALRHEVLELGGELCRPFDQFLVRGGERTLHLQVVMGCLASRDYGRPDVVADALLEDDDELEFVGGQDRRDHRIDDATAKLRELGVNGIGHSG